MPERGELPAGGGEHAGDPSEITDLARRLCPPPHPAIYRRRAERGEILGANQGFFTLLLIASVPVPCERSTFGAGGGIRTHTVAVLGRGPLPLGYAGLLRAPGVSERVAVRTQDTEVRQVKRER